MRLQRWIAAVHLEAGQRKGGGALEALALSFVLLYVVLFAVLWFKKRKKT